MKVLVVSHLFPHDASQTSGIFVRHQAASLASLCQVQVVAPVPWCPLPWGTWGRRARSARRETASGVAVSRPPYVGLPRRLGLGWAWRPFARAVARDVAGAPDVIHAHCAYPDGYAALHLARRWHSRLAITVHGFDVHHLPGLKPAYRRLVAEALAGAGAVIAVSRELGDRVADLGVPRERIVDLPNGVDCERFDLPRPRRRGDGGWRLLYLGRFEAAKGVLVLLEAVARLRRQRQDFTLRLVGGNPATGQGADFAGHVDRLGLQPAVRFDPEVPWEEVPRCLAAADALVLPSFSEGMPTVVVEALAAGVPVVSTRCGGPEEVIDDEVGLLVEPGDTEGLARALDRVMSHPERYPPGRLRERARSRFDQRRIAQRLLEVYQRLPRAT